jgi:transposase
MGRKGYYESLIAIANKHAHILRAMLAEDAHYDAAAWPRHPVHQPPPVGNA